MTKYKNLPAILLSPLLFLISLIVYIIFPQPERALSDLDSLGSAYEVTILRDSWGIPHVFGVRDADAAFGLGYAHSEDDFLTIQQIFLAARGELATVYGLDAAPNDYMVRLLRIWDDIDTLYENDLLPETRTVLQGYADGLNYYAALHPDEVLANDLFPLSGLDLAAASVHRSPLFFGLDGVLGDLFAADRDEPLSPRPQTGVAREGGQSAVNPGIWMESSLARSLFPILPGQSMIGDCEGNESPFPGYCSTTAGPNPYGSNVFAVSPIRTVDGSTMLAANSHQPWDGPVAWYEAHIHSEEGWDMTGSLFPGSPVIITGHNRDLGWSFTVNHPDLVDVYVLELNPDDENQYRFDGTWLDLEIRRVPIRVRLLGNLIWPVQQEFLWSVYGPVVRQPHGTYALRYAGYGRADIFEQLYLMNKAGSFQEWHAALSEGGLPMFNVGYADRNGNIYYAYNGLLPIRAEGWEWDKDLPGDTSETLWTEYLPFDELPQVLNPASGFVQNSNSSPFQTTLLENPDPNRYSASFGIELEMTNRALRALELLGADAAVDFGEFIAIKYDMSYSAASDIPAYIAAITGRAFEDPLYARGQEILADWDLQLDPENPGAALMVMTLYFLNESYRPLSPSSLVGEEVPSAILAEAFESACRHLSTHFGRLDPPWMEVNRLVRGDLSLGLGGGPDILHAIYGDLQEDGRLHGTVGDGLVYIIRWPAAGPVESFAIHQYGAATRVTDSPHYSDQAPLFASRMLRVVWFEEADIRANLEAEYRPGEETGLDP